MLVSCACSRVGLAGGAATIAFVQSGVKTAELPDCIARVPMPGICHNLALRRIAGSTAEFSDLQITISG